MKKLVSVILILIMSVALVTAAPAEGAPWFAWAFNTETGLLVIGGEGELPVFTEENPAPWARFQDRITRLILDEGITGIPAGAFAECVNLVSLVLPASLESVDETAFSGCKKLTQIQTSGDTEATKAFFAEILPAGDRLACAAADLTRLEREVRSVGKPRLIPGYDGTPSEAPETETVQTRAAGSGGTAGTDTAGEAKGSTEASAPKGEGSQDPAASAAESGHTESAAGGSSGGTETAAAAGSSESTAAASSGSTAGTGSAGNAGGTETAESAGTAGDSTTQTTARSKLHGTSTAGGKTQGFWSQVNNEIDTANKTITITETKTYDDGSQVVIVDHVTNFDENNIAGANPQTRTVTTTDAQGNTSTQTYNWAPRGGDDSRYMVVDQETKNEVPGADPTSTGQDGTGTPIETIDAHYYQEYEDGTAFEQTVTVYPDEKTEEEVIREILGQNSEPTQENPSQNDEPTP